MKCIYYAHSVNLYGTAQEERDIRTLELLGFTVWNPNTPAADFGYKQYGMEYFKEAVQACDALAFRGNPGGYINAGVDKEIAWAAEKNLSVIELPSWVDRQILSVDDTREYLREVGHR